MDLRDIFEHIPFAQHLGLELTEVGDGYAEGRLDLRPEHSSRPDEMIAHGGVAYALADTVGGAAVLSTNDPVTPTIDMRIDYLAPATGERLRAEADVVRDGNSVATVDVRVTDGGGEPIATARGVYKTGGGRGDTPWLADADRDELD